MKSNRAGQAMAQQLLPTFGSGFLEDHAHRIMADPGIAIIELVANSWDAGADQVDITWPDPAPDPVIIQDNGTGMTHQEFIERWRELNYNRKEAQGEDVVFPSDNQSSHRKAFGRNGKGRHSAFCFADEYTVITWRDGQANRFNVRRATGATPFTIAHEDRFQKEGHGTVISTELVRNHLPVRVVRDLIGSKFIADPAFKISVNGEPVELTDLEHLFDMEEIIIEGVGIIVIRTIDSQKIGRTSKQHGVAWWVNKRLVGEPSWKGFDNDAYLDARSAEAKRYTFVVEADILVDEVEADWSGFKDTEKFEAVRSTVRDHILRLLGQLMHDAHRSRKVAALKENRENLKGLPTESRYQIGHFVDELQARYPSLGQKELSATVEVLSRLEKSRSGFTLLEQLAKLPPNDLDALSEILAKWSVQEARIVLDVLEKRLKLIESLENLVESPSADELHDIQPLFEGGLWIFGPEYESIDFTSNRNLITVVKELFKDELVKPISNPRRRPDFVALPNSTLGIYSRDSFDERSEVNGIAKVLIVELKRGGFEITSKEVFQAQTYTTELRKSKKVQKSTTIVAFVLGTTIADDTEEQVKVGDNTTIYPRTYSTVLRQAHARTFHLLEKIREVKKDQLSDPDVENVLSMPEQVGLFSD